MAARYIFTVTLFILGLAAFPYAFGRTTDATISNSKGDLESEHSLTAYAQWVHFTIRYVSDGKLVIKNSDLPWGKWYTNANKDQEIASPDGTKIDEDHPANVYSCGRSDAASGTQGSFELWTEDGALVSEVYWNCPWGSKTNKFSATSNQKFITGVLGGNTENGAIGDVTLTVIKIPTASLSVV